MSSLPFAIGYQCVLPPTKTPRLRERSAERSVRGMIQQEQGTSERFPVAPCRTAARPAVGRQWRIRSGDDDRTGARPLSGRDAVRDAQHSPL